MTFPSTPPTVAERTAVNQVLQSIGQAPVTSLQGQTVISSSETPPFNAFIDGTTLTTNIDTLRVGSFLRGRGVLPNTAITTDAVASGNDFTYDISISQTVGTTGARVTMTALVPDSNQIIQTNPDVALILNTIDQVSREVQAEGWTFNQENYIVQNRDVNNRINVSPNMIQLSLSDNFKNRHYSAVQRDGQLYDRRGHTFEWDYNPECDVVWEYQWDDLPKPIQEYIVTRSAMFASQRLVGDPNQYAALQQQEILTRANALQYETDQGDYTFFGQPDDRGNFYRPFKPFHTLYR